MKSNYIFYNSLATKRSCPPSFLWCFISGGKNLSRDEEVMGRLFLEYNNKKLACELHLSWLSWIFSFACLCCVLILFHVDSFSPVPCCPRWPSARHHRQAEERVRRQTAVHIRLLLNFKQLAARTGINSWQSELILCCTDSLAFWIVSLWTTSANAVTFSQSIVFCFFLYL